MTFKTFIFSSILIFFAGCSFKTTPNQWKYDSVKAYKSYTKNFLINKQTLAKSDLEKAINYAKQSADLNQLAKIYLGKCALDISVGVNSTCEDYQDIRKLVDNKKLDIYFSMLQKKLKKEDLNFLPKQYEKFYQYYLDEKIVKSFDYMFNVENITSLFIVSSLHKDKLSKIQINKLIDKASFYGYKRVVLYWLNNLYEKEENKIKKDLILEKINILKS